MLDTCQVLWYISGLYNSWVSDCCVFDTTFLPVRSIWFIEVEFISDSSNQHIFNDYPQYSIDIDTALAVLENNTYFISERFNDVL